MSESTTRTILTSQIKVINDAATALTDHSTLLTSADSLIVEQNDTIESLNIQLAGLRDHIVGLKGVIDSRDQRIAHRISQLIEKDKQIETLTELVAVLNETAEDAASLVLEIK